MDYFFRCQKSIFINLENNESMQQGNFYSPRNLIYLLNNYISNLFF